MTQKRIGITADVHFHNWRQFAELKNGINSRLLDVKDAMSQITSMTLLNDGDTIIVAGDFFHKRGVVDVVVGQVALSWLKETTSKGVKVYILVGNHDQADIKGDHEAVSLLQCEGVTVINEPSVHEINGKLFYFHPFIEDQSLLERNLFENAESLRCDYWIVHAGVAGAKVINTDYVMKEGVKLDGAEKLTNLKAAFFGHYHLQQILRQDPLMMYVGSPIHHTFHDEGVAKSFVLLDPDTGEIATLPLRHPKFISFEATKDSDILANVTSNDFYRINAKNFIPSEEAIEYIAQTARNYEIVFEMSSSKTIDKAEKFDISAVISQYVKGLPVDVRRDVYKDLKSRNYD